MGVVRSRQTRFPLTWPANLNAKRNSQMDLLWFEFAFTLGLAICLLLRALGAH
jgi:hypothetical protein